MKKTVKIILAFALIAAFSAAGTANAATKKRPPRPEYENNKYYENQRPPLPPEHDDKKFDNNAPKPKPPVHDDKNFGRGEPRPPKNDDRKFEKPKPRPKPKPKPKPKQNRPIVIEFRNGKIENDNVEIIFPKNR